MFKTAIILASGKGSRMNVSGNDSMPKHLKMLPNGQTIVGRVAESLAEVCDRIICTIRDAKYIPEFENAFIGISKKVELVVKRDSIEFSEISQVAEMIPEGNVIQTNGDLIAEDNILSDFVRKYGDKNYFIRGREGNPKNKRGCFDLFNSRISVVPVNILKDFSPESKIKASYHFFKSLLLGRVVPVPTLFNIDTPEDYERACKYFKEKLN